MRTFSFGLLGALLLAWGCGGADAVEGPAPVQPGPLLEPCMSAPEPQPEAVDPGAGTSLICHVPPGHPENARTLAAGAASVEAHLAHGDSLGACP